MELCKIGDVIWEETWCLRENEMAMLRRTERAMVRAMCGAKLMERKTEGRECWFGKGQCYESSKMESGSWRDCC